MTTRLQAPLKRELDIDGQAWTLTLSSDGFTLVPKGRRKGLSMTWQAFVSGDAALAASLNASLLQRLPADARRSPAPKKDEPPAVVRHPAAPKNDQAAAGAEPPAVPNEDETAAAAKAGPPRRGRRP